MAKALTYSRWLAVLAAMAGVYGALELVARKDSGVAVAVAITILAAIVGRLIFIGTRQR